MTEQELDLFMRNVLLDAIALDEETNTETIPYTPSLHHQKQIKAMLKNPLRWARDRKQPVWKRALKRVAVILLVISLAFGSLMVVSPTARATFIRWVTEWYETLNKLPENYRTVFIKSFFEGKTHTEIAEEMNLSVKSINRYKQKTMELLRNELKDYMPLLLLLLPYQ